MANTNPQAASTAKGGRWWGDATWEEAYYLPAYRKAKGEGTIRTCGVRARDGRLAYSYYQIPGYSNMEQELVDRLERSLRHEAVRSIFIFHYLRQYEALISVYPDAAAYALDRAETLEGRTPAWHPSALPPDPPSGMPAGLGVCGTFAI